jgi:hypothetical protein
METRDINLTDRTVVTFATMDDAMGLLGARDTFVERMGPFDRMVRMKSLRPLTIDDLRIFAAGSAREWDNEEIKKVSDALKEIGPMLFRFASKLPEKVILVKTSGDEEFKSAYTRGNAVILPLNKLTYEVKKMELLLIHELFHIITRNNPSLVKPLYSIIGFYPCGKVEMPAELKDKTLANLDTPDEDYCINVFFNGEQVPIMPIFSFKDGRCNIKEGEDILLYLTIQYLALEKQGHAWKALYRDGKPLCIDPETVSGFYEQVGKNTDYVICPEEILAENFVLLVTGKKDIPTPEIIDKMGRILY